MVGIHPPAGRSRRGWKASPHPQRDRSGWSDWSSSPLGGVVGWLVRKPLNDLFARFLGGFNTVFDIATNFYGRTVTRIIRFSIIALRHLRRPAVI